MKKQNKRLDRLRDKLADMQRKWVTLVGQRKYVEAQVCQCKINALKEEIAECEKYEPKRLSEQLDSETLEASGIIEAAIRTHFAADFLNDCTFDLKRKMDKAGMAWCSLYDYLDAMEDLSRKYASFLANMEFEGLADLMVNDEQLIDDLHNVIEDFINKNLKIIHASKTKLQ